MNQGYKAKVVYLKGL